MKIFRFKPKGGLNFGDELGPLLCSKILKRETNSSNDRSEPSIFTVGSIIHFSSIGDTIWGSGINGKVSLPIDRIAKDYRSVRGFLTKGVLSKNNFKVPDVVGDPALLVRQFIQINKLAFLEKKTCIIPNYNDFDRIYAEYKALQSHNPFYLVHPFSEVSFVINLIASCEKVITSSLHAMILADVFEKPSAVLGGNGFKEHPFKYLDYVSSLGHTDLRFASSIADALRSFSQPRLIPRHICEDLLKVFPYDRFLGSDNDR